jgi:hypothetical protein
LYGYSLESPVYMHSKVAVQNVWSELKAMGMDLSFVLETTWVQSKGEKILEPSVAGVAQATEEVQGLGLLNDLK